MTLRSGQANVLDYWRDTVAGASSDDVDEVGHPDMGRTWNAWAYRLRKRAVVEELERLGVLRRDPSVFEAAYGVGYYLELWRTIGCKRVAGMDISERAHRSCSARFPEFELHLGALQGLGRTAGWENLKGSFDVATAIDVLYHIVDDDNAAAAVAALADIVRPGGTLIITDKVTGLRDVYPESDIVTRRPVSWYAGILQARGFTLAETRPIFWCMDPPAHPVGAASSVSLPRVLWILMRASLKYLPRNGVAQRTIGNVVGGLGYAVDRLALKRARDANNLSLLAFRKTGAVSQNPMGHQASRDATIREL
jgi:SAM-dependent methyltransferase